MLYYISKDTGYVTIALQIDMQLILLRSIRNHSCMESGLALVPADDDTT